MKKAYLVTGVAGFIGFSVAKTLLQKGEMVVGIDNFTGQSGRALQEARLEALRTESRNFHFHDLDVARYYQLKAALAPYQITHIVHLAAEAGVRLSIDDPLIFGASNLQGHLSVLEYARHTPGLERMVYASSSSVYGDSTVQPFTEQQPADEPVSLYAATKRSNELMSDSYSHLYGLHISGLRFFTVYGPWGRPDMATWLFTKAILTGEPIKVFNKGKMRRDFTYIDDIVGGLLSVLHGASASNKKHEVYNIGSGHSTDLMQMIEILEQRLGKKAVKDLLPMQPGDVLETFADTSKLETHFQYRAGTSLEQGIDEFITWFEDMQALRF